MGVSYDTIKHSVSISEVLRHYGYPVRDRASYRIGCPIHGGKDANFSVSERNGLWNCFSVCGRGGSVIDLVAELEKITVAEAAKKIVEEFKVSPIQTSAAIARATVSKIERYKELQQQSPEIKLPECTTLETGYRGLSRATIEHWGLARTSTGVLIPLLSSKGKLCSYAVRRDDGKPKYENAAGVSKCLPMGLFENKEYIIKEGFSYVTEGQFDAIALWDRDFKNTVALMGSSMTEQQAMLLLSLTSNLILIMDGDEVGKVAASKIKKAWSKAFDIGIVEIPDGKDPDQLSEKELRELLYAQNS